MVKLKKLWMFAGWNNLSQEKRKTLLDFNTTDVVLGTNVNKKKFVFYNREKIIDDCRWLHENNIDIHLMPWVNCTDSFFIKMTYDLYDIIEDLKKEDIQVKSILLDVEKNWYKNTYKLKDYIEDEEFAIEQYIDPFRIKIKAEFKTELGTTSLLRIPEKVKKLAEISDYTIPQAYSVYFPTKKNHWSHDYIFNPIVSQKEAYEWWKKYSKKIVMGLACYYEKRPGWSREKNLDACLKTTLELNIDEVAYWDLKQCVGKGNHKEERRKFLSKLIKKVEDMEFDEADWKTLQKALNDFHFNPGPIDGIPGPLTMGALDKYRINFELKRGGEVNVKDLISLLDNYCF